MKQFITIVLLMFTMFFLSCGEKQEAEKPKSMIQGDAVEYIVNDTPMKGYIAYDKAITDKRPGILVVHEWWGHNEYARKRAQMLAELGYTALAVDMYGNGKQAEHPDDAGKFMNEVLQNMESGEARFKAALEVLKNHSMTDPERIAAIGYCFGGAIVLHMARIGMDLDGVVSFHGSLGSMHKPEEGSVKAKVLVCHGADDQFTPQEQIDAFKKEMDEAKVDYQFTAYPGAKHSFTNPDADVFAQKFSMPLGYNEEADKKSWEEMQNFFKSIFSM